MNGMFGLVKRHNKVEDFTKEAEEQSMTQFDKNQIRKQIWARKKEEERQALIECHEKKLGYCPKCYCMRTYNGKCPNGCDDED